MIFRQNPVVQDHVFFVCFYSQWKIRCCPLPSKWKIPHFFLSPSLIHAYGILLNAMDKNWSNTETGKWPFVTKASDDAKTTSKVIGRLKKKGLY